MTHTTLPRPYQAPLSSVVATCAPKVAAACAPKGKLSLLQRFFGVWRQRRHLERLSPQLRADIGLSDAEIARETQRPIWDVPQTWRY